MTGGPRLNFPNGGLLGNVLASVKPYAIFDEVGLGEEQYFNAYGTGLEYDETVWNDMLVKSAFEFRQKNFTNAPDRPLSRGLDGSDKLVSVSATKPVAANAALNLEFDYLDQTTRLPYYTNSTYAVIGAYRIHYDAPLKVISYPWETLVFYRPRLEHLRVAGPVLQYQQRPRDDLFNGQPIDPALALRADPGGCR